MGLRQRLSNSVTLPVLNSYSYSLTLTPTLTLTLTLNLNLDLNLNLSVVCFERGGELGGEFRISA